MELEACQEWRVGSVGNVEASGMWKHPEAFLHMVNTPGLCSSPERGSECTTGESQDTERATSGKVAEKEGKLKAKEQT